MKCILERFTCLPPSVTAPSISLNSGCWAEQRKLMNNDLRLQRTFAKPCQLLHPIVIRQQMIFPDKRLIQFDCGKLQMLDSILREEKKGGHRVLLFTQMTKMLDVLEEFLNLHHYRYLRLDGRTKTQIRAKMMERFNRNDSYFVFILSTRSGGLGLNLTGADRVIFYDIDWNPAIDLQAQDRAHRIGQTRDVKIYKLITTNTVEENILKKQEQKRRLNAHVIGDGCFTTDTIQAINPRELLGLSAEDGTESSKVLLKEVENAMLHAEDPEDQTAARSIRREQRNSMVEFDDSAPINEFQEFERKMQELENIDKYALRFFVNDRRPIASIEKLEEYKKMVSAARPIFFLQCSQMSERLNASGIYSEDLFYRRLWDLARNNCTALVLFMNKSHQLSQHFHPVTCKYNQYSKDDIAKCYKKSSVQLQHSRIRVRSLSDIPTCRQLFSSSSHICNILNISENGMIRSAWLNIDAFETDHSWSAVFLAKNVDRLIIEPENYLADVLLSGFRIL